MTTQHLFELFETRPSFCKQLSLVTAVVKNVVGKHYFLAVFGPKDAHFSSQPLRQPHRETQPYSR